MAKKPTTTLATTSNDPEGLGYLVLYRYNAHWHTYLDKTGKQVIESRAKAESVKLKLEETLTKDGRRAFSIRVVELPL